MKELLDSFGRPFDPLPCVWRGYYYPTEGGRIPIHGLGKKTNGEHNPDPKPIPSQGLATNIRIHITVD